MKLRGKQKRYLRSRAHSMRSLFQIGKDGVNDEWLKQINNALEKRELIKINILNNSLMEPDEVQTFIEENSDIQVVQIIGHTLVLFKRAQKPEHRYYSVEAAKI